MDFRKNTKTKEPLINGVCVEQVNVFKLLCTSIMDNLLWSTNTEEIVKSKLQYEVFAEMAYCSKLIGNSVVTKSIHIFSCHVALLTILILVSGLHIWAYK